MVMSNTCEDGATEFKVTMRKRDRENMLMYYETVAADGSKALQTIPQNCEEDKNNRRYETCSFIVGEISDYEDLGYPSSHQPLQGMRFSNDAYGQLGVEAKKYVSKQEEEEQETVNDDNVTCFDMYRRRYCYNWTTGRFTV
jgi:hypothetical protein